MPEFFGPLWWGILGVFFVLVVVFIVMRKKGED